MPCRPPDPAAPAAALPAAARRADLIVTGIALLAVLAWDVGGGDLATVSRWGGPGGFPWRDAWLTGTLLHEGERMLGGLVLFAMALQLLRPPADARASRARQARWIGVVLLCLVIVPGLKQLSLTSCPWDLAQFGGRARHVSHWLVGVADGGPGRCFPSGHATAAFAFFGGYFLWRPHRPRLARAWLAAVLLAGLMFGLTQVVRGAHYPSHVLWSAWLCWAVGVAAVHAGAWRRHTVFSRVRTQGV